MFIKRSALVISGLSLLILIIGGCGSDEENPITPTLPPQPPTFQTKAIDLPQAMLNSSNDMAKQAIAIVEETLQFEPYGCRFEAPADAEAVKEKAGDWEYKWTTNGLTQTLQITSVSGRTTWKIFYDGSDGSQTYNNWRFMDTVQSTDLSSGHITLFKAGTNMTEIEWVWYTLELDVYKLIKQFYGEPPYKIEITVKPDKSGKIDKFTRNSAGNMVYDVKFSWNEDGSGSYWTFEEGVQTSFGTW